MRCLAEWPLAPVDKRGPHAVGFRSDAVEGVIGDEQDAGSILANNLRSLGIRLPMRLEIAGLLYRNDVVEPKPDVRRGGLEHVAVAVRKDRQLVSLGPKPLESGHNVGKRLELLDFAYEPARFILRVRNAAAIHHIRDGAMPDLAVGRVPAIAERINHRVLEVGAAPPSHETVGLAVPPFLLQKGRDRRNQSGLHIDNGAVLVECDRLDFALENFGMLHVLLLESPEP